MAAYAAVISLKNTVHRLLNSSHIAFLLSSREILEFAYKEVKSLQDVLEGSVGGSGRNKTDQSERATALEEQLREATCELEDVLECHVSKQILPQAGKHPLLFSADLEELREVVGCFTDTVKKVAEEYTKELDNNSMPADEEGDEAVVSATTCFGGNVSEMVGFADKFVEIRDALTEKWPNLRTLALIGMAGIGKTTLAKKIFDDPLIKRNFECRIFVPVGQKSLLKKTVQAIVAQVKIDNDKMLMEEDERCWKSLVGRRCLIVLDDVWNTDILNHLERKLSGGTMILVTTRLLEVGIILEGEDIYEMRFLNTEESWNLLREKVFADKMCPPQLEKAGKKIAENCEGLPLLIVRIADLLSNVEKSSKH